MIKSLSNPLVKHLLKLRKNRDYREEQQSCLIAGEKFIEEVAKHAKPKCILSSLPKKELSFTSDHFEFTTPDVLEKVTGLKTFAGAVAEFPIPPPDDLKSKKWILAIDRIADPGNIGTLIRTASALNWEGLFFLPHTVDPFNDKALRSSKGAIFHLPYAYGSWEELKALSEESALPV